MKQFGTYGKIALIAFGVVFLTGAAGPVTCSQQIGAEVATLEAAAASAYAKIKATAVYIKANQATYVANAKAGIQILCALDTIAANGASALQANINNPPSKVQAALDVTLTQASKVSTGCAAFAQTASQPVAGSDLVGLAAGIWNGYQGYKSGAQQVQTAMVAAGGGK